MQYSTKQSYSCLLHKQKLEPSTPRKKIGYFIVELTYVVVKQRY